MRGRWRSETCWAGQGKGYGQAGRGNTRGIESNGVLPDVRPPRACARSRSGVGTVGRVTVKPSLLWIATHRCGRTVYFFSSIFFLLDLFFMWNPKDSFDKISVRKWSDHETRSHRGMARYFALGIGAFFNSKSCVKRILFLCFFGYVTTFSVNPVSAESKCSPPVLSASFRHVAKEKP